MSFKNREEYEEWIQRGKLEECDNKINYKYVPDCNNCNYAEKISNYEHLGWSSVPKLCRICLGLGKYKKNISNRMEGE